MGFSAIILLLIGAVACEPFYNNGEEYHFDYKGKVMTGIPKLDAHYSGMSIQSKIIFQSLGYQKYKLAMKNMKHVMFNDRLSEDISADWRKLNLPEAVNVPAQFETILETPVEFAMQDGEVRDIKASRNDPEWAVNIKKSIISILKIQLPIQHDLESNTIRSGFMPGTWEVMEQGVDGKCENTYHVTEIPEAYIQELAEDERINIEECKNKKIFQLMKTRDTNKCVTSNLYQVSQPGKYICPSGNCDDMWQRTSTTQYIGCGNTEQEMKLQVIVNEGELLSNFRAYKAEKIMTGVRQVMRVEKIQTSMTSLPEIQSPRNIEGLFYEYPLPEDKKATSLQDQQEKLRNYPVTSSFLSALVNKHEDSILSKLSPATLKKRIMERLDEITNGLEEVEQFEEKQTSLHVLAVSKVLSVLGTEDMKSMYEEIKQAGSSRHQELKRQLFLEVATITGTNPAISFLKQTIENKEMSDIRAVATIAALPHYIKTPSIKIINEIFELVKSPVVQEKEYLKINAMMAFGTIVNRACLDKNRQFRFPVFVYGEFCTSHNTEITTQYIPYLVNQLEAGKTQREKASALMALGNLGHESVIQILMPYIEGKKNVSPLTQRMAIYSLNSLSQEYKQDVINVFSSLVFNQAYNRDTRIAALSMMLNLEPSFVHFQKLATATWFEKDTEFHKFVYSTLKSLSQIKEVDQPNTHTSLYHNSHKAKMVIHLAKPIPVVFSSALNYFSAEYLKDIHAGYHAHIGSHSLMQKDQVFYGKLEYFLQQLKFSPIEFCAHIPNNEHLSKKIMDIFGEETTSANSDLQKIFSQVSMKKDESSDDSFASGIWARLYDDIQVMYGIGEHQLDSSMDSIKSFMKKTVQKKNTICGKTPFDLVKVNNWAPTEIIIPSDMGLPIFTEIYLPAVIATHGDINIDCSGDNISASLEMANKISAAFSGYMGTICPFSKEIVATGVDLQHHVNYPMEINAHYKNGKLDVAFTESEKIKSSTEDIDVWAFTVKPYSVIKPLVFVDGIPLTADKNTKFIHAKNEKKSKSWSFGQSMGLDLQLKVDTESHYLNGQMLNDYMSMYKYNPVNFFLFGWNDGAVDNNGEASCRRHEMKLVYNPKKSSTKEINVDLEFDFALKSSDNEEPKIVKAFINEQQQMIKTKSQAMESSNSQHQKIKEMIKKTNIDEGFGLCTKLEVSFVGGAQKAYSYELTAAHGFKDLEQVWNLHLESDEGKKICMNGKFTTPKVSEGIEQVDSLKVFYENTLGFGKSCEEYKLEVTGTTKMSREQRERSKISPEAQKCSQYSRKVNELREQLRMEREESDEYKNLEAKLVNAVELKREYCDKKREQGKLLDVVYFTAQYTPMPEYVRQYAMYLDVAVKGALLPYMSNIQTVDNKNEIEAEIQFNKEQHTFNMVLTTDDEKITYDDVQIPEKMRNFVPMVASSEPLKQIAKSMFEDSTYPKCRLGDDVLQSFAKRAYPYVLDDCYHILSADPQQNDEYAILAREQNGKKDLKAYIAGSEILVKTGRGYTDTNKEYEIEFDGREINLGKNEKKELHTKYQRYSCSIRRSVDDVLIIEAPQNKITFDGKIIEIENTGLRHIRLKGLCGNTEWHSILTSAQGQQMSSAQAAALTFRVQDKTCSQLSLHRQQQQQQQQQQQSKQQKQQQNDLWAQMTQLSNEKCSQMKHSMIKHQHTLCISQVPVMECGSGCGARSTTEKPVPFTCLPSNRPRVVKLYEEKVRRGDILPELRNMEKSFTVEMEVPVSCANPGY